MFRVCSALLFALALLATSPSALADEVRRDPKGIKGISPTEEHIAKGRAASASGDHDGAIDAFDAAIAEDSARIMPYLLKAQSQLAKGDSEGAYKTARGAQNKRGDVRTVAKLAFFVANLAERHDAPESLAAAIVAKKKSTFDALKSAWEKVKGGWTAYTDLVKGKTEVPSFPGTAEERHKKIDERVEREKTYGAVAKRIADKQAERDKKKAAKAK